GEAVFVPVLLALGLGEPVGGIVIVGMVTVTVGGVSVGGGEIVTVIGVLVRVRVRVAVKVCVWVAVGVFVKVGVGVVGVEVRGPAGSVPLTLCGEVWQGFVVGEALADRAVARTNTAHHARIATFLISLCIR